MPDNLRDSLKPTSMISMFLQYQKSLIRSESDSFKEYIIDNRLSIQRQQEEFNKMIKKQTDESPDDAQEIYEWYQEQYYQYNEFYPALFNSSSLLSIYSSFEFNLKQLSNLVQRHRRYKIKIDDLNGQNYIEKSKRYLTLVADIDLNSLNTQWQEITKYQNVRNCIVHNNSNIIRSKDKKITEQPLYQIVKGNHYLKLNEDNGTFIIFDDRYLTDFCDLIEQYLTGIVTKLEAQQKLIS